MTTTDRIHIPTDEKIQINFQELRGVPNAVYGLSDGRRFFFSRLPNELDTAFAGRIQNTLMDNWGVSSTICNIECNITQPVAVSASDEYKRLIDHVHYGSDGYTYTHSGPWSSGGSGVARHPGGNCASKKSVSVSIYGAEIKGAPTYGKIVYDCVTERPLLIENPHCRCYPDIFKNQLKPQRDHSVCKVGQGYASNEDIWAAVRAFGDGKI